jgi:hypothetical protein
MRIFVLCACLPLQPLPSPEAANTEAASYLCWHNQPQLAPLADSTVTAQHFQHQPAGSAETAPSSLTPVESNHYSASHGFSTETDRVPSALRTSVSAHAPPPRRNSTPTKQVARPQSASVAAIKAAYSQSGAAPAGPKAKSGPAHAVKSGSQSRPSSSSSSRPAAPSNMLLNNNIAKHSFSAPHSSKQQAQPPTKTALAWSIRDSRDFAASAASALATHGDAHHRGGKENQLSHHDHEHDRHEHDQQLYHAHSATDQMQQQPRRSSAIDAHKQPSESHAPHNINASRKAPALPHGDTDFSAAIAGFFTQLTQLLVRVQSTLPPPASASALAPADASHALAAPGAGTASAHTALAMASHALSSAFAPGLQPPHSAAAANHNSGNAANVASSQSQSQPSDAHLRRSILDALANEIAFVRSSEYAQMVRRNRLQQQQLQQFAPPPTADRLSTTSSMFDDNGLAVDDWDDADSDASSHRGHETDPKAGAKADPKAAAAKWARRSRDHQQRVRQWQREADRAPHRVIAASLAEIEREMRARDSSLPSRSSALATSTVDMSAAATGSGTVQAAANAANGNAAAALSTDQLLTDFFRTSVQLQMSLMPSASQQHPSLPVDASAARQSSIAKSLVNVAAALREARMEQQEAQQAAQQAAQPTRADTKAAGIAQTTATIGSARSTAKPSAKPSPSAKSTVTTSLSASSSSSTGAAATSAAKVDSDRVRLHLSATDMTLGAPQLSNRYRDANASSNSNAASAAVVAAVVPSVAAAANTSAAASVASATAAAATAPASTASAAAATTSASTATAAAAAASKKSRNISISSGSSLSYSSDRSYSDASFDTDRDSSSSSSSSPSSSRNASARTSVADPKKAAASSASAAAASATAAASLSSSSSTSAPVASKLPPRNSMLSAAALSSSSEYDTDFEK